MIINFRDRYYNKSYIFYTFAFLFRLNTISTVCSYNSSPVFFAILPALFLAGVNIENQFEG